MSSFVFPTLLAMPTSWQWGQRSNVMLHTSPLSGNVQSLELPGARWMLSLQYSNLIDPDRGQLEAFLTQLRGMANRATIFDIVRSTPQGTMRGTMTVTGAIAAGATGCTVSASGQGAKTLLRGDKLNIGGELKMIVADATADGSGNIVLTVEPPFRSAISNGASVAWQSPTALFLLTSNDWRAAVQQGAWSNYSLDFMEVFA